jgi:hypothetical protein
MGARDRFIERNVGYIHARAHDVVEFRAGFLQRGLNVSQGLHGLGIGIALTDNFSVRPGGGGT